MPLRKFSYFAFTFIFISSILATLSSKVVLAADPNCAENAPNFLKYDPSAQVQKGQSLKAIFVPPQTFPDPSWKARYLFFVNGKTNYIASFDANNPPSSWEVNIDTSQSGNSALTWYLQYKSSASNSLISLKCGSYPFNICDGSCTGTGTVVQNPCSSGTCATGIGSFSTDPKAFATGLLKLGTAIGGGIALILMVIGSIRVLMSSGDQQKLSAGRDMIVAAVSGLLFLIFSVLILRFIGVNILGF